MRRQFAGDPRVVTNADPEEMHPFAAFRLELPPGLEIGDKVVRRLVHAAATTGVVEVGTAQGVVRVGRTRALARVGSDSASRWEDAGAVFGAKEMRASDFHLTAAGSPWRNKLPPKAGKVVDRVEGIRSWDDFVGTMQWLFAGLAAVLRLKRRKLGVVGMSRSGLPRLPLPGIYSTGGEGFSRLPRLLGMRADLVYGNKAPSAKALEAIDALGGKWLQLPAGPTPLAVPPFDPLRFNPVGWTPRHSGADRRYRRIPDARPSLRVHRSVVIPAPRSAKDAAKVARLAGLGVVMAPSGDGPWEAWLGPELSSAINGSYDLDNANERELASVRARRAAHAHHSEYARRGQLLAAAGLPDPGATSVSVVLATNRPDYVAHALEQVAKQDHRPLEVVLGLHGDGFAEVDTSMLGDIRATVIRANGDTIFGELLDLLTAEASGDLIAKMDDDDHYGPNHITDLVVAARYSDAALVGKGAEFIHLHASDRTVRRVAGEPETGSRTIGGGAMAIHRRALREVGGWARVHRGVDQTLITAVKERGLAVHRTHGFGYVLERRPTGHTWAADDAYFDRDATGAWDGLETDVSDVTPPDLR
ncbi:MAG: glycosyltransferase family 2 protein [Acidimicrobiia bacterium]|nr:glycosyltransferase family 2 protein [Acidimicrobiia bacterium]